VDYVEIIAQSTSKSKKKTTNKKGGKKRNKKKGQVHESASEQSFIVIEK
jgi:hypothetical protein